MKSNSSSLLRRVLAFAAVVLVALSPCAVAQSQQQHVHAMAPNVMPFDLAKTVHVFIMTDSGGVERVVTRSADAREQVPLIQQHLQHEASRFQRGDYADPAALHGASMPGLRELQAGASKIKVAYTPLANGAEIRFHAADVHMITAIHRWFGAQLSEHGADAKTE